MSTTEEDATEQGHHLPASEDWPDGFGEASWWPVVTALGVTGIYVGVGLYVLGAGEDPLISPLAGIGVIVAGLGAFLAGLYGWLYHGFVSYYWSRSAGTGDRFRWGMLLFLGSEVATFGAGFTYYFFIRAGTWPPEHLPHLLSSVVLANTLVLIASSVTLHYAHRALGRGDRTRFIRLLGATLFLGVLFVLGQVWEYYQFIVGEGFTVAEGAYASAFFGLTGLHGLHVSLGAVLLGIVFARGYYGQYSDERHSSVTTVSMYWHFVDAVWIFLVITLYLGAAVTV